MQKFVNGIIGFDKALNHSQCKKELILHIGHKKTGSSFIQSVLERNSSLLEKHGYYYPSCSDNSQNAFQGKISSGNGFNFLMNKNFQTNLFHSSKLRPHNDKSPQKIILSSELLFDHLVNNKILEKINSLNNTKVIIILYTRNVFEYLTSLWGQEVARGNYTKSINTFLDEQIKNQSCDFNLTKSYLNTLSWINISKKYNFELKLRNYSVVKKNLLEDFFQCFFEEKINNFIESLDLALPPKVNRSLSEGEYFLQKEFNKVFPGSSNLVSDILINNLPSINSEIPFIEEQSYRITTSWVSEYVKKINLYLSKKHKIRIETYEELTKIMNKKNQEKKISYEQVNCLIQNWTNSILQNRTELNIEEVSPFLISLFGFLSSR